MQALGIDIGGSGIKGAPVDLKNGKLLNDKFRIETPVPATPANVFKVIHKIQKHFNWTGNIGCGFPAVITENIVQTASNIDSKWIGKNISKLGDKAFKNNIHFINDADAAGLAEMQFGAGKDFKGLAILITIGTGIGTSLFYENHLFPNSELGQLILNGQISEHYASNSVREKENLTWKKWALRFNEYLNEIERLLWPELIIIGGGISKKTEKYLKYLNTKAKVIPAQLRNNAGIIGAALSSK